MAIQTRAMLLILAVAAGGPLPAQDAPPTAPTGAGAPTERAPAPVPAEPSSSGRVFKPSEEVSPDMEVDFPADI